MPVIQICEATIFIQKGVEQPTKDTVAVHVKGSEEGLSPWVVQAPPSRVAAWPFCV